MIEVDTDGPQPEKSDSSGGSTPATQDTATQGGSPDTQTELDPAPQGAETLDLKPSANARRSAKETPNYLTTAPRDTDPSDDDGYVVRWEQCDQISPAQAANWSHEVEPVEADITHLRSLKSQAGLHIAADLEHDEKDQIFHWLPTYVDGYTTQDFWFLSGTVKLQDSIPSMTVVQDVLSRLEEEPDARHLFDLSGTAPSRSTLVIVELLDTRVVLDEVRSREIDQRLRRMGVSMLLLLEQGFFAKGPLTNVTIWSHDLMHVWWRHFYARTRYEQGQEPSDDHWASCLADTEQRRASLDTALKSDRRRGNLRELLLRSEDAYSLPDAVESFEELIKAFQDQDEHEKKLRDLLKKAFPEPEITGDLSFDLEGGMPKEPFATALFVFWACVHGQENDLLFKREFEAAFQVQLEYMKLHEDHLRARIANKDSLKKKQRRKKLEALDTSAGDFLDHTRLHRDRLQSDMYRQLNIKSRLDAERGEVLSLGYVNGADVIGSFLKNEAEHYLDTQSRMYLAGFSTLYLADENAKKVVWHLAVREFTKLGSLSEGRIRGDIVRELIGAFRDTAPEMARLYRNERVATTVSAAKLADFIVYWFDNGLPELRADAAELRANVRNLVSDLLQFLLGMDEDSQGTRNLVFVCLLDRITSARDDILNLEKLIKTVGNSAKAELQAAVLDFFDQLGSLYDKDVDSGTTSKKPGARRGGGRHRASRMQFELFDVVARELERVSDQDPTKYYPRFLANIALQVIGNGLIRADEKDYRPTDTPGLCTDRMLSRVFEEPDGIERVVAVLLSEPVLSYPLGLLDELGAERSRLDASSAEYDPSAIDELRSKLDGLQQLYLRQGLSGLKFDVGDTAGDFSSISAERAQWHKDFKRARLNDGQALELLQDENTDTIKTHPYRLLLELYGLLKCSGRTDLSARLDAAVAEKLDRKTGRSALNAAKLHHRAYLLQMCEVIRQAAVAGELPQDGRNHALNCLKERLDASRLMKVLPAP